MNLHIAFLSAALIAAPGCLNAKTQWSIGVTKYTVDTIYHATVGPGTTETELRITGSPGGMDVVNNIFYTETDITNPYVEMRAAKAGNTMRCLETVPEIAARMTAPGEQYFAGVNADFFNMGYPYNPIGMCVADGFLTNYPTIDADIDSYYLVLDDENRPSFARHVDAADEGRMTFANGLSSAFRLNVERDANSLVLYTPQWQRNGSSSAGYTGANAYGVEVALRQVGCKALYGSTIELEVVDEPESAVGNMKIPDGCYVASAHGTCRKYLNNLHKGDVVVASVAFSGDSRPLVARNVLGGFPQLLNVGNVLSTPSYPEHLSSREPRSAFGCDASRTKLYMVVVDGRKAGGSSGVTQRELAYIMRNIGCTEAMNFDGGGSSTMFVDGLGIRNVPSSSSLDQRPEGQPRTVVNALFAVSTAPVDNNVAAIEICEKHITLSTGESIVPTVYAYNRYGALINHDLQGCTFDVADIIAHVSGSSVTAGDGSYSGYLTATYCALSYSVPIDVNGGGEFVSSGIVSPVVDNTGDDAYYMINGVRVANPVPGQLHIVKTGCGVEKRIVR